MTKEKKVERVNITLSKEKKELAQNYSERMFGQVNLSGFISFLIDVWDRREKKLQSDQNVQPDKAEQ